MSKNTGRNILFGLLGYFLLTGNYKAARNLAIGYVVGIIIAGLILLGIAVQNTSKNESERVLFESQVAQEREEALEYAAEVLPSFVAQFKGKMHTGEFNDLSTNECYKLRFKVLNDSLLNYQIAECEDYGNVFPRNYKKWGAKKTVPYKLEPTSDIYTSHVSKDRLSLEFDGYHGDFNVVKSKKKNKYRISMPITLYDQNNASGIFWDDINF